MQLKHNQEPLVHKLQSATAYVETILELYQRNVRGSQTSRRSQRKVAPLELVQSLQAVVDVLHEIRREVLLQELTTVLHNEALPTAARNEKVVKIFQSLA
jgi:hypothetical protein